MTVPTTSEQKRNIYEEENGPSCWRCAPRCCLWGASPQSVWLTGTREFVSYTNGRVRPVFDIDSTLCFDGAGNGA